jgi:hypothetical protein
MTGGQVDGDWSPEKVGGEVDLGGAPASRDADRLILRRFFWAPAAERWAFTQVLSTATVPPRWPASVSVVNLCCQILRCDHDWPGGQSSDLRRRRGQQAAEAIEAVVDRRAWAVFRRTVTPPTTGPQNMENTAQDPAVVNTPRPRLIARQKRLDQRPGFVAQPEMVAVHY